LEQGFIFTAMILAAATVAIIERRFVSAAVWCFGAAVLALTGFIHSYRFTHGDAALALLEPATRWAIGYCVMGALFLLARWVTEPSEGH